VIAHDDAPGTDGNRSKTIDINLIDLDGALKALLESLNQHPPGETGQGFGRKHDRKG
jgi:hypothetical protein